MREFFIVANSFSAPFVSDQSTEFLFHDSPETALECFASMYKHPAGLYAAECYESANAYHKGDKPLARWLCNHEAEKQRLTKDLGSYSYLGHGPGEFEINGVRHTVEDPKGGRIVQTTA